MIKIENYCLTVITVVTDSGKNHQSMPRPLDERLLGSRVLMVCWYNPTDHLLNTKENRRPYERESWQTLPSDQTEQSQRDRRLHLM